MKVLKMILLWISGVEPAILQRCPHEEQKYIGIGGSIFATCLVGFVSSSYAAYYFTVDPGTKEGSYFISMLLGLFWATIIMFIDRSMVVTLKKDPDHYWSSLFKNLGITLLTRMPLAFAIAFVISVPLELKIFEGFIDQNKEDFNNTELLYTESNNHLQGSVSRNNEDLTSVNEDIEKLTKERDELENKLKAVLLTKSEWRNKRDCPESETFKSVISEISKLNEQERKFRNQLANAIQKGENTESINVQIADIHRKIQNQRNIANLEKNAWNKTVDQQIADLQSQENDLNIRIKEVNDKLLSRDARKTNLESKKDSLTRQVDESKERKSKDMTTSNQFVYRFRVLNAQLNLRDENGELKDEYSYELFWLVRCLFIFLELLPTITKLVLPIGCYDRILKDEEKKLEEYLASNEYIEKKNSLYNMAIEHKKSLANSAFEVEKEKYDIELELVKQRNEEERKLHATIVAQIVEAQKQMATQAMETWKKNESLKLEQDLNTISLRSVNSGTSSRENEENEFD